MTNHPFRVMLVTAVEKLFDVLFLISLFVRRIYLENVNSLNDRRPLKESKSGLDDKFLFIL